MRTAREQGAVLVIVMFLGIVLLSFTALSLDMTRNHTSNQRVQQEVLSVDVIVDSALAQALGRLRESGIEEPQSGGGATPVWVTFGDGEMFYRSTYDALDETTEIRAWGRVPVDASPSVSTVAPDDVSWDGTGWLVRGVETHVLHIKYIPEAPMYVGNGGVEAPLGGFLWTGGYDVDDPSSWDTVLSDPSSWQASWVPFELNALNHPADTLYGGTDPPEASPGFPHPYHVWAAQNPIGQFNSEAWFTHSADSGDPTTKVTPDPNGSLYDTGDQTSLSYPYPVIPDLPDVQSFVHDIWNEHSTNPAANILSQGSHSGTFGDLTTPEVTIVTGALTIDAGDTLKGAGILVIRDDYDPNVDTDNTPADRACLYIHGNLEWTGLVIVAGWAPTVHSYPGSDTTIVGALLGEDAVQSGAEVSLDSATITMQYEDSFRIWFSMDIFELGGFIHDQLPEVERQVVGVKKL